MTPPDRATREARVARAGADPAPLPGSLAGDLALAVLVLLLGVQEMISLFAAGNPLVRGVLSDPVVAVVVGSVLLVAQAAAVLARRRRPRRAYLLAAALMSAHLALVGGFGVFGWGILAFAVARSPGSAAGRLVLPLLGALVVPALLRSRGQPDSQGIGEQVGAVVGMGLSASVLVLIGLVTGRWTRTAARRAEEERRETERIRRAAALDVERARIAEEIGSGVLTGLHRVVDGAAALGGAGSSGAAGGPITDEALRALHGQARAVLAAMRRVLGVLRSPGSGASANTGTTLGSGAPASPAPTQVCANTGSDASGRPAGARVPPLPDRVGLVTLGVFLVLAAAFAVLPRQQIGSDQVDLVQGLLQLPPTDPLAALVVAVQFAAIAWWRTAPASALLVSGAGSFAAGGLGGANLFAETGWVLLVWGAATRAPMLRSGVAVLVSTAVVAAGGTLFGSWEQLGPPATTLLSFLAVVPLWAAGVMIGRHRRVTERLREERADADARDAVGRERLRVARELHDVVAHHVSAIAVQAGAARMAADPAVRAEALAHIAESGRRIAEVLPELAGATPDPHGLTLDPDGVDRLLIASRKAGLPVHAEVTGTPVDPPGDAELFAQRIVTEALTNVLRHAGASPTVVRIGNHPSEVTVEVTDEGPVPGHRPDDAGSGLGLVGMHERVALLGGRLTAGPSAAGGPGWTVRATLPRGPLVLTDETGPITISSAAPTRADPDGP
ncbi:histidine kinase [Pseudonocardia sp. NPDC049635]|uniref:sensor histidine kinase n=1 Tax=Pseudonocardia sp. NPDC049635 TaxID=3155506 RepID=UPI0033D25756